MQGTELNVPTTDQVEVPRKKSKRKLIGILAVAAVIAVSANSAIAYAIFKEDSGVTGCKVFAEAQKSGKLETQSGDKLSADEYKQLRALFSKSDHEEIKTNGVKFVDAVWQISQLKKGEEFGAIAFISTLAESYSGLTGACGEHDIVLTPLGS